MNDQRGSMMKNMLAVGAQLAGLMALALVLWFNARSPSPKPPDPVVEGISLPAEVKTVPGEMIDLDAETRGKEVRWWASDGLQLRPLGKSAIVASKSPGRYTVLAWACIDGKPTEAARCTVLVVGIGPVPIPPGPTPPQPPIPPAPIPVSGFRVIMVAESQANMTREQLQTWSSTAVRDYLNRKTAKTDGRPGWRQWDPNVDVGNEGDTFKKLWAATKPLLDRLPAILIVNDTKGEVHPWPADEKAALELLKKYGGE